MMKKLLATLALLASLLMPNVARASWGCEVLLCLSNPAGPMAVAACVPPIKKLYAAIFKWPPDPFPTCIMSNGASSATAGNYATVAAPMTYYAPCKAGEVDLGYNQFASMGMLDPAMPGWPSPPVYIPFNYPSFKVVGIGDGTALHPSQFDSGISGMPWKTCVAGYLGTVTDSVGDPGEGLVSISLSLWNTLYMVPPTPAILSVNVYLNNAFYKTVVVGP